MIDIEIFTVLVNLKKHSSKQSTDSIEILYEDMKNVLQISPFLIRESSELILKIEHFVVYYFKICAILHDHCCSQIRPQHQLPQKLSTLFTTRGNRIARRHRASAPPTMPSPAFVSLSPPSSFLPRSSSPVSLPLRPSLFPSAPPRILRAAPCATLADGLVRTPAPGEAGGAPFSAADWDNAQRDESVGAQAWDALKEIVPYRALRKIAKTGAYLGNELGAVHKEWDAAEVRFVLAYPDAYSIGMSSTGHVVLYSCLNESDRLLCDRAYVPGVDMQAALKEAGKPVFAVESKRPLADFHVVGMSISYELCATNCLAMMELGHLPKTWAERDAASPTGRFLDGPPLVFAGGLTITANPEPYCDFFDFFSLGDGEDVLPAIGEKIADVLKVDPDVTREELTLVLAKEIPGVYAPRFYEMDEGAAVARPIRTDVPARPQRQNAIPEPQRALALVPQTDAIHDRLSIEIRRGCTRGCRFVRMQTYVYIF